MVLLRRLLSAGLPVLLANAALAAKPLNVSFPETPSAAALKNVVDDNYVGISWELSSFDTLWGKTVKTIPPAIQNYLHNVAVRQSKPLRIRVGGNGMDGSTYVRNLPTFLELIDPNAYFNDVPVKFGPIMLDVMNEMYNRVGPMQFILGVGMKDTPEKLNLVQFAEDAEKKFGDRLDAFLLGNEPDLYTGHGDKETYDVPTYIDEIGNLIGEFENANALPRPLVGGPTTCCGWNLSTVIDAGLNKFPYKYYTVQRYPKHQCGGVNEDNTNLTYFTTHANLNPYLNWQQEGIIEAQQNNVPVLLTEYNTVACGGTNISSTFGATLWLIDAGLKAATANYSAVYLHTREYEVQYNLFDPPTPETSTQAGWRTGSPYYAALFLAEATDPTGTVIVDLNLNNSNTNQESTVVGYGLYHNVLNGSPGTRGKLALLNYADSSEDQIYHLPQGIADRVNVRLLTAPSITERTNISWAGQTVGDIGNLLGDQLTMDLDCSGKGGCDIRIPSPGAALVGFSTGQFFTGNSTLPDITGYLSGAQGRGLGRSGVVGVGVGLVAMMIALLV